MAFEAPSKFRHRHETMQRERLPVIDSFSGTGNGTIDLMTYDAVARDLLISNDSSTDSLTILVTGKTGTFFITLLPWEVLDERFREYYQVDVTATGAWRAIARGGDLD